MAPEDSFSKHLPNSIWSRKDTKSSLADSFHSLADSFLTQIWVSHAGPPSIQGECTSGHAIEKHGFCTLT
eukprot:g47740.t1